MKDTGGSHVHDILKFRSSVMKPDSSILTKCLMNRDWRRGHWRNRVHCHVRCEIVFVAFCDLVHSIRCLIHDIMVYEKLILVALWSLVCGTRYIFDQIEVWNFWTVVLWAVILRTKPWALPWSFPGTLHWTLT